MAKILQLNFNFQRNVLFSGQKLVFILGNLANVALAMYKCHSMGLLPTHVSDWLAFADPIDRAEFAMGGLGVTGA